MVLDHFNAGIAGSNPALTMVVCPNFYIFYFVVLAVVEDFPCANFSFKESYKCPTDL
jgi:hypothetical protein